MNPSTPFLRRPASLGAEGEASNWGTALLAGASLMVLGVWALLMAGTIGRASIVVVGALLIFSGGIEIFHGARDRTREARHRWTRVLLGALSVIAGALFLMRPVVGLTALGLMLASYLLASGLLLGVAALWQREAGWGWDLLAGSISWVLGVWAFFTWPGLSVWAVGALVAVELVSRGVGLMGGALHARRASAVA